MEKKKEIAKTYIVGKTDWKMNIDSSVFVTSNHFWKFCVKYATLYILRYSWTTLIYKYAARYFEIIWWGDHVNRAWTVYNINWNLILAKWMVVSMEFSKIRDFLIIFSGTQISIAITFRCWVTMLCFLRS